MNDLIIIIALILLNGVFSMSEVALISARKPRLAAEARKGSKNARIALQLSEDPDRFLSTVQIGITLIGILTGLFSGAAFADDLAVHIRGFGIRMTTAKMLSQAIIVVAVTYLSIVVGELLPKRIGLNASYQVALVVARPMRILSVMTMPAVWLLSKSTSLLSGLLHIGKDGGKVTEEEIKSVIREGTHAGEVKTMEQDIMFRALVMGDEKVNSIMTPRIDIVALDLGMDVAQIKEVVRDNMHSAYPVYDAAHEGVVGIVYLKDLVFELCDSGFSLSGVVRPGVFMPESMLVYAALALIKREGAHCGLVCDEFGAMQGLLTLCDILGGLVGSVEVGTDEPFIIERTQGDGWLVDGQCPVYDFLTFFELEEDYGPAAYTTVAGLVLDMLKRIPATGDAVAYKNLNIEVVDMDGVRIDKLLVSHTPSMSVN